MGNATLQLPLQNKLHVMLMSLLGVTQDVRNPGQGRIAKPQANAQERIKQIQKSVILLAVKQDGQVLIVQLKHSLLMRKL
jgi:hypothetical protein